MAETTFKGMLDDFAKVGKVTVRVEDSVASGTRNANIKCELTGKVWSFSIDRYEREDAEFNIKATQYQLDRIEEQLYIERGKHLTKSYEFYEKEATGGRATSTSVTSSGEYVYGYGGSGGVELELPLEKTLKEELRKTMKGKVETKFRQEYDKNITEKSDKVVNEIDPILQAERKKLLDENKDYGAF